MYECTKMNNLFGVYLCVLMIQFSQESDINYDINTTIATTVIITDEINIETLKGLVDEDAIPRDCSQREKRKTPFRHTNSHLKKCCPLGESLTISKENQSSTMCESSDLLLLPNLINVTLYDNCIEDMETDFSLPLEIGNPCNTSILYNDKDDLFFVIQDGSLLVMDLHANDSYSLYSNYCIDLNNTSGTTYAIVCITSVEEHINRSQSVAVAFLMLISIPCLLLVAYIHLRIKPLRSLHGLILSCMSVCLATGYFLYSLVHIFKLDEHYIGYAVQFFCLSYYFWFFSLCCNVALNIWIYIPLKKVKSKCSALSYFGIYCSVSFFGALILVIFTIQKGLPGMPSYFIQGYTESIRESQRYFIPPVSSLLLLSFFVMTAAFFGFQKFTSRGIAVNLNNNENFDRTIDDDCFEEVKKDAKCISLLGIILLTTWLFEIITFYSPGPQIYIMLMDMINGLQGVFVLLIFLIIRRRRTLIFRWWVDRGSHAIDKIELDHI